VSHTARPSASASTCKSEKMIKFSEICRIGRRNPDRWIVLCFVRRRSAVATNNTDYKYNSWHLFLDRTRNLNQELQRAANLLRRTAVEVSRLLVSIG
jgi:hypothetical protein